MNPTLRHPIREFIGHSLLKILGWKALPMKEGIEKAVVIMAPHSSTWDICIGLCLHFATNLKLNWVGKKELFRGPLGPTLKAWGGIPLDREGTKNLVEATVNEFRRRDHFLYGLAPEGTRSYAPYWKSGFYHIAIAAKVPIVFYFVDFKTKISGCGPVFHPTGDITEDMKVIRSFYEKVNPRNPKNCGAIAFKPK